MELTLTQADLERMPAELRRRLFLHLGRAAWSERGDEAEGAPLGRWQVTALLREISFHRSGASLRALLDRLAYEDTKRPPSRQHMAEALHEDGAHLGRYVAVLNQLAAKVTRQPGIRLCRYHAAGRTYTAHSATRQMLRELLPAIKASGEAEEPLWE